MENLPKDITDPFSTALPILNYEFYKDEDA